MILVVLAIVVVLVVVVAGLWAAGIGPFSRSSNGASTQTFSQAAATAAAAANGQGGGLWTLAGGFGIRVASSVTLNSSALSGSLGAPSNCTETLLPGASSITSIPGTSASPSAGVTSAWIVEFFGTGKILAVAVLAGAATPLLTITGGTSCPLSGSGGTISLPSGYLDSPAAASAAFAAGGAAFAANHSEFDVAYSLSPQISVSLFGYSYTVPAAWHITLSNCDLTGQSSNTLDGKAASQFGVEVNATSGIASGSGTAPTTCRSSGPSLGSVLSYGTVRETSAGSNYYYNSTVQSAGAGLKWGNLTFHVRTAGGSPAAGPSSLTVTDAAGTCNVAVFSFASSTWSTPVPACASGVTGPDAPILLGASVNLYSFTNLDSAGDTLVTLGTGSFSGSMNTSIP